MSGQGKKMKNLFGIVLGAAVVLNAASASAQSKDYFACLNSSNNKDDGYAKCYLEEAKRDVAEIDSFYQKLSSNPKFSAWNNGNGMFKGNFKDMLDTWVSYRNRYCSLYAQTYSQYDGSSPSYHQADCIMKMTRRHAEDMKALWQTSISKIDNN